MLKSAAVDDPLADATVAHLAAVVERIRATGYPTPAWLVVGRTATGASYHLQEFAPERPPWPLTVAATERLVEVLERQAGLDPDPARDRSAQVSRVAVDERVGGLRHTVRQFAPGGAAQIARYDQLLALYGQVDLPTGDMVHGDFNTCNVLLQHGAVTAVIVGFQLRYQPAVVRETMDALQLIVDDLTAPPGDER